MDYYGCLDYLVNLHDRVLRGRVAGPSLAIRSLCGFAEMWGMVRATARVPIPLHTAPALTMRRGE
jgi:hypothetical protein